MDSLWTYILQCSSVLNNGSPNNFFLHIFRWEDYLQTPLQPLADNLDTHTYNVFEKDPIKYDQYQKAIAKALIDLQKQADLKNSGVRLIILYANCILGS